MRLQCEIESEDGPLKNSQVKNFVIIIADSKYVMFSKFGVCNSDLSWSNSHQNNPKNKLISN